MNSRSANKLHTWVQLLLVLAIAIVANHLSSQHFGRLDLTKNASHTLSIASADISSQLQKPLLAKVIFTPNLKAPYNNIEADLIDKLNAFKAYSNGHIEVEVIHPSGTREDKETAEQFGVTAIQYRFRSHDRFEMKSVYMGLALVYGDGQRTINPITTTQTLEYQLAATILSLSTPQEDKKVVGYLQGNGEPNLMQFSGENPIAKLTAQLSEQYQLLPVVLGGPNGVPEEIDALLVVGPQSKLHPFARYQLDQFLMRGGSLAMFLSNIRPDFNTFKATPVDHGLDPLLGHYGVTINKDTLVDRKSNEKMPLPVRIGKRTQNVPLNYPLIPTTTNMQASSPVSRGLERAILPFSSSLTVNSDLPTGVHGAVWLQTEDSAVSMRGLIHIRPDVVSRSVPDEVQDSFGVAAGLSGSFTSYYAGKPIPTPAHISGDDQPLQKMESERILDGAPARIAVVSSADFVANNPEFVLNTIDWTLQDRSLISIRNRATDSFDLRAPEPDDLLTYKLGIVGFPLLLLIILGSFVTLRARRHSR